MKSISLSGALLLSPGCTADAQPRRAGELPLPTLVAQRVAATVSREALQLVRLETEHGALLTTPEHPFGTPGRGWISAGRLVPGDWVVSERFGAVRLLSVHSEPATRPVPVFNLKVASSHAYLVGTARVLVHNTSCGPSESREAELARIVREREELNREIKALTNSAPTSPRIGELKTQRDKLRHRIDRLRRTQRQRAGVGGPSKGDRPRQVQESDRQTPRQEPNRSESTQETIERLTRERAGLVGEIANLRKTAPSSPRIAELKAQAEKLHSSIMWRKRTQRNAENGAALTNQERGRQHNEADLEAVRQELQEAQSELAALEHLGPSSEASPAAFRARRDRLRRRIASLNSRADRTQQVLTWLDELAELEAQTPATEAERWAREEKKKNLRADIQQERTRLQSLRSAQKRRGTPEGRDASASCDRACRRRLFDELGSLENELASLRQEAPSESRDARIDHLTDQIETAKRLIESRKQALIARLKRRRLEKQRERLRGDPRQQRSWSRFGHVLDESIEQAAREHRAARIEVVKLRVREQLLAQLGKTPWTQATESVDEARLREFERQLSEGLESEQQLDEIERGLDAMNPSHADLQDTVLDEADDVDEVLSEHEELMQQRPSPERAAGLQSSYERLQQELREERAAVEVALSALVNEHANVQTTQAGSSTGATWQERLRAIQNEQRTLRAQWRSRLQARLLTTRDQLNLMRSIERLRDEEVEADLARQIALLERELQLAG